MESYNTNSQTAQNPVDPACQLIEYQETPQDVVYPIVTELTMDPDKVDCTAATENPCYMNSTVYYSDGDHNEIDCQNYLDYDFPSIETLNPDDYFNEVSPRFPRAFRSFVKAFSNDCPIGPTCLCHLPEPQRFVQKAAAVIYTRIILSLVWYINGNWSSRSIRRRVRMLDRRLTILPRSYTLFHDYAHLYLGRVIHIPRFEYNLFKSHIHRYDMDSLLDLLILSETREPIMRCYACRRNISSSQIPLVLISSIISYHTARDHPHNTNIMLAYKNYLNGECSRVIPRTIHARHVTGPHSRSGATVTPLDPDEFNFEPTWGIFDMFSIPKRFNQAADNASEAFQQVNNLATSLNRSVPHIAEDAKKVSKMVAMADTIATTAEGIGSYAWNTTKNVTTSVVNFHDEATDTLPNIVPMILDWILRVKALYNVFRSLARVKGGLKNGIYLVATTFVSPVSLAYQYVNQLVQIVSAIITPRWRRVEINGRVRPSQQRQAAFSPEEIELDVHDLEFTSGDDTIDLSKIDGDTWYERLQSLLNNYSASFAALITTCFAMLFFEKSDPKDPRQRATAERVGNALRNANQFAQVMSNQERFRAAFDTLVNIVKELFTGFKKDRLANNTNFKQFLRDVSNLDTPLTRDRISSDRHLYKKIGHLNVIHNEIVLYLIDNPSFMKTGHYKLFQDASKLLKEFNEIRHQCHSSHLHPGRKFEPFVVHLGGAPGLGKSTFSDHLAKTLGKMFNIPHSDLTYHRAGADKYWSKYKGEFCVLYDDLYQARSGQIAEEEVMEQFGIKTCAPLFLNMADVKEKGKNFVSEAVIASTNTMYPISPVVRSREALWRRRDLLIELKLASEEQKKLNYAHWQETGEMSYSHLSFIIRNPLNPDAAGRTLTFEEFERFFREKAIAYFREAYNMLYRTTADYELRKEEPWNLTDFENRKLFMNRIDQLYGNPIAAEPEPNLTPTIGFGYDLKMEAISRCKFITDEEGIPRPSIHPDDPLKPIFDSMDESEIFSMILLRGANFEYATAERGYEARIDTIHIPKTKFDYCYDFFMKCVPMLASVTTFYMLWKTLDLREEDDKEALMMEVTSFEAENFKKDVVARINAKLCHEQNCSKMDCWLCEALAKFEGEFDRLWEMKKVEFESRLEPTSRYSAGGTTRSNKPRFVRRPTKLVPTDYHRDQIEEKILKSTGTVHPQGKAESCYANAIAIKGDYALINRHVLTPLELGSYLEFRFDNTAPITVEYRKDNTAILQSDDVAVIKLDNAPRQFPNLLRHFVSDLSLGFTSAETEFLVMVPKLLDGTIGHSVRTHARTVTQLKQRLYTPVDNKSQPELGNRIWHSKGYTYRGALDKGDSGSICYALGKQKIIGIQSASDYRLNLGYCALVTSEMLEDMIADIEEKSLTKFPQISVLPPEIKLKPTQGEIACDLPEGLDLVGIIENSDLRRMPDKTSIEPSLIHHHFEPTTAPAILSNKEFRERVPDAERSFAATGIEKYADTLAPMFPIKESVQALDIIFDRINRPPKEYIPIRKFTDDEVLNGLAEAEEYTGLNMESSAGWPYANKKPSGEVGKAWLFDVEVRPDMSKKYSLKDNEFTTKMLEYEANAKCRRLQSSVFVDCPKDERRPLAKVNAGKTRMFTIAPAHHLYLSVKYYGAFQCHMVSQRLELAPKVGTNCMSPEWTHLYRNIVEYGNEKNFLDRDVKAFDGWRHPWYTLYYTQKICEWYRRWDPEWSEEDDNVRFCLAMDAQYRCVMNRNYLYVATRGLISGKHMTDIDNSIQSEFYSLIYWICNKKQPLLATDFYKYVKIATYGDDVIEGVDPCVLDWYNLEDQQKWFAKYGITITDAAKRSKIEPAKCLDEIQFLKRKFDITEGEERVLAPLDKGPIEEMPLWVHKNKFIPKSVLTVQNVESALREAVYHGRTYYNNLKKELNAALAAEGIEPVILQYTELKHQWLQQFE